MRPRRTERPPAHRATPVTHRATAVTHRATPAPHLRELLHRLLAALVAPVDDVDSVRHRVGDVLLHEAAEAAQVRRDARDPHHRALRCTRRAHHRSIYSYTGSQLRYAIALAEM